MIHKPLKYSSTGSLPFVTMLQIFEDKQRLFDPDCPVPIKHLVKQCTQKDPKKRPDIIDLFDEADGAHRTWAVVCETFQVESIRSVLIDLS